MNVHLSPNSFSNFLAAAMNVLALSEIMVSGIPLLAKAFFRASY